MRLNPGQIIFDRFVVEELLDEGSMGQIWRGRHLKLSMPVALKTMRHTQNMALLQRFEREAQLMARINHANVVRILDYGVLSISATLPSDEDGQIEELELPTPCIVMEFIHGEPLMDRLDRSGALAWRASVALVIQILEGLEMMHDVGILHRDLKPSNILLTHEQPERVKLVDLGIAKPLDSDGIQLTAPGVLIGTPAYMAPEQLMGDPIDTRSEQYAVGLILYELLTGSLPFGGERPTSVMRRLRYDAPVPEVPPHLETLPIALNFATLRALARQPDARFDGLATFTAELRRILHSADPYTLDPLEPERASGATEQETLPGITRPLKRPPAAPAHSLAEHSTLAEHPPEHATTARDTREPPWVRNKPQAPVQSLASAPPEANAERFQTIGVLVSRLPASRMMAQQERDQLTNLLPAHTRAFFYRGYHWIVLVSADAEHDARATLVMLEEALRERYMQQVVSKKRMLHRPLEVVLDEHIGERPPPLLQYMAEELS